MTPEQRVEWAAEVRSLYDRMVQILITPTWAKPIDFETTLPSALEELARQPGRASARLTAVVCPKDQHPARPGPGRAVGR